MLDPDKLGSISGTLHDGDSDTEVVTVSAGGTTSGQKYFKTVTDIKANLNPNGNVIIGTVRDQDAIFTSVPKLIRKSKYTKLLELKVLFLQLMDIRKWII